MTTFNLQSEAVKIGTASVKNQKAHVVFRLSVIAFFQHCKTTADAELLVTAIYKAHTNSKVTKDDKASAFAAARSSINKILKGNVFPFSGKAILSAKSPDKKTGKCPITEVQTPKGGVGQKRAASPIKASKAETGKAIANDLAKATGPNYDDRLFAVMQSMRSMNINAGDLIPELFSGLTAQAQADCIKSLQATQTPMLANKATLKTLKKAVNS